MSIAKCENHGIIVEDITDLVCWYQDNLSLHPVTNQQYSHDEIVHILCKLPQANWTKTQHARLYLECELQREIISFLRLDKIQSALALKDIIKQCVQYDEPITNRITVIAAIARDVGV